MSSMEEEIDTRDPGTPQWALPSMRLEQVQIAVTERFTEMTWGIPAKASGLPKRYVRHFGWRIVRIRPRDCCKASSRRL